MDELVQERLGDIVERLNEVRARLEEVERDNDEVKKALVVVLTRLKKLEGLPPASGP